MHSSAMIGNQLPSAFILLGIIALASGKPPPPPGAPWAKFVSKPVFERSLGPPPMSGVSTMQIPYIPKPMMFPKFVDPRMMMAKKTDLLSNLFGGLGPAIGTPGFGSPTPYAGYGASPYYYYPAMYGPEDSASESPSETAGENGDLPILYGSGFDAKTNYFDSTAASNMKRGLFGPMGGKSAYGGPFGPKSPMGGSFYGGGGYPDTAASADGSPYYKRGLYGPKVMPFVSPFSGLTASETPTTEKGDYLDSISKNGDYDVTGLEGKVATQGPPSSYPKIPIIPEEIGKETTESSLEKIFGSSGAAATSKSKRDLSKRLVADDSIPKEYLPGMFGPMGPGFGPPGGMFGPDVFMSKKSMFLDTLFKNIATSTTPTPAVTEVPVTEKSTIVPPGFWLPESVVPDPGAYNAKVGIFLEKLFDSLKLNASTAAGESPTQTLTYEESISAGFPTDKTAATRSLPFDYTGAGSSPYFTGGPKSVRSLADPETVMAAKDQIVNSIIGELKILKDDMIATFDELIVYQKNQSMPSGPGSKPFKPFPPPFWSASAVTATDIGTLPYKRRMLILDQVFDMLIELQTNVSAAVSQAVISNNAEEPETEVQTTTTVRPDFGALNISILDAIQAKLGDLNTVGLTKVGPKGSSKKFSRALPESPSSFWVAYPGSDSTRRNLNDDQGTDRHNDQQDFADESEKAFEDFFTTGKDSRAIKMQMHQGYQSLPPGTIQSIQAGGGSVPGHEGGGVKLLGPQNYQTYQNWQDWSKAIKEQYANNNRHHHHGRH